MCQIKVPAPGAALVFFSDDAQNAASEPGASTFPTTAVTKTKNTVTIDPSVLATSNGQNGKARLAQQGGTSEGSSGAHPAVAAPMGLVALMSVLAGLAIVARAW